MIAFLSGTVAEAAGTTLVLDVHGVGYLVTVTPEHALSLRHGEHVTVHTVQIVREDDISLFGFEDRARLAVFDQLRGVNGVGPKSALGVLGVLTPEEIAIAVAEGRDAPFRKVVGIGPKTAKQIVLSLGGKLALPNVVSLGRPVRGAEVLTALVGLGYAERDAKSALDDVLAAQPEEQRTAFLLRAALAELGPRAAK